MDKLSLFSGILGQNFVASLDFIFLAGGTLSDLARQGLDMMMVRGELEIGLSVRNNIE